MTAPTREQLLVLADRAERGPLTAAEAGRLRQGIAALTLERRSTAAQTWRQRETVIRIQAVRTLLRKAQAQGVRTIPVQMLAAAVGVVTA